MVLDGLVVPDFLLRTASLGHSFNHPDRGVDDVKRTMTEEFLRIANLFNNIEDIVVTDRRSLNSTVSDLIRDVQSRGRVHLH